MPDWFAAVLLIISIAGIGIVAAAKHKLRKPARVAVIIFLSFVAVLLCIYLLLCVLMQAGADNNVVESVRCFESG